MKKYLFAASAIAFVASPAVAAPTTSEEVVINATVQDECNLSDIAGPIELGNIDIDTATGTDGGLDIDGATQGQATGIVAGCNYNASIQLETLNGGLLGPAVTGPDAGDFTNIIEYTATFDAGDGDTDFVPVSIDTRNFAGQGGETQAQTGPFVDPTSRILVSVTPDDQGRPVAGAYTDTLVVTLGAS